MSTAVGLHIAASLIALGGTPALFVIASAPFAAMRFRLSRLHFP